MEYSPGTTFERYTIEGLLGQGGMGQVYRAFDPKLQRRVALKVLRAGPQDDQATWGEAVARMLREARAAAALDHPNVVAVFDLGEFEGTPFIAMELVAGVPLRQKIGQADVSVVQKLRWIADVARALAAAHEVGIIHRDIKPENILVRRDGVVKVLDFGIARRVKTDFDAAGQTLPGGIGTITVQGSIVGTPAYMAPEQVLGEDVDARTDQFAWGVLAYELLSGALPWDKQQPTALMAAVLHVQPAPLNSRCSDLPEGVQEMIDRALSKSASGRFSTMREIVQQLDEVLALASLRPPRSVAAVSAQSVSVPSLPLSVASATAPLASQPTTQTHALPAAREKSSKRTVLVMAAVLVGLLALILPASRLLRKSLLSNPRSLLACPPWKASVQGEPVGWLGASAANLACNRAAILLGGRHERTLSPAQLLSLPGGPKDQFPRDPYNDLALRDRAVAAAKAQATAWLDGEVIEEHPQFRVKLILRKADGTEIGRGTGTQKELYRSIRDAMVPLVSSGALPEAAEIEKELAPWTASQTVAAALAAYDLTRESGVQSELESECQRAAQYRSLMRGDWAQAGQNCTKVGQPPEPPPVPDRSSASAFVRSVVAFPALDPATDRGALAEEARRLREKEPSAAGRRALAKLEAALWYAAGNNTKAREVALALVQEMPSDPDAWYTLQVASYREPGFVAGARAFAAWVPEEAEAWNALGFADSFDSDAKQLEMVRRAMVLSSDLPAYAINLAGLLVDFGRREEVRSLGAHLLLEGASRKVALDVTQGMVDASEGRLGAAFDRWMQSTAGFEQLGDLDRGDYALVRSVFEVADILGRREVAARQLYSRFIEPDPPNLYPWHPFSPEIAVLVCLKLSRELGHRCLDRVDDLVSKRHFRVGVVAGTIEFLRAAQTLYKGNNEEALRALRLLDPGARVDSTAELFDAAGAAEDAQRADNLMEQWATRYHGATFAAVRSARRANKLGDRVGVRRYAERAVAAWDRTDAEVPSLAEMRALLKALGPATSGPGAQ